MAGTEQTVDVDGHKLRVTHLDKVLYPATGTTKADVIGYMARIADVMVPHTADRPVTRKRWVQGVDSPVEQEVFFQKDLGQGVPPWVTRVTLPHADHTNTYPIAQNRATLAWLAQLNALEVHVPQWRVDTEGTPRHPDRIVFDLDPGPGLALPDVAGVAVMVRELLEGMGLDTYPVTSGSKGIHVYAGLDERYDAEQATTLARELARSLEADHPDLIVSEMRKSARVGKVFIDWSQNTARKTTVAPYSLRGTSRPQVAAPRTWAELADPGLRHLGPEEVLALVAQRGDPMAPLGRLPEYGSADPLSVYRAKRDAARTPEPMPAGRPAPSEERVFVIQEHHASSLHFDLRLSHEGVLASWALPKGVPTDPARNHLAVRTEDHPMAYLDFAGEIPRGEYGAGTMTVWDTGTYELEKWREAEVIVTLHGRADGPLSARSSGGTRLALIRTGANWLAHLMAPRRAVVPTSGPATPTATAGAPRPMLATATDRLPREPGWAFEMKWDGVRALIRVAGGQVSVYSRTGRDVTGSYPELAAVAEALGGRDAVLDGEIVAIGPDGRPDFGLLQPRMNAATGPARAAAARQPVTLMLFDLLALDGADLAGMPYTARRERLAEAVTESGRIHVPPSWTDAAAAEEAARRLGLEGVMAKQAGSTYAARRSTAWLKAKFVRHQEAVVIGWREGENSRAGRIGSLLLAVPEGEGWHYAGRVGSGITEQDLREWPALFEALAAGGPPVPIQIPATDARGANWLRPELVAEVRFADWSHTGRLRHPVWRGWRPDKAPGDVVRES